MPSESAGGRWWKVCDLPNAVKHVKCKINNLSIIPKFEVYEIGYTPRHFFKYDLQSWFIGLWDGSSQVVDIDTYWQLYIRSYTVDIYIYNIHNTLYIRYISIRSIHYIYIYIYIYIHTIYPFDVHIHIHWFMVVPYHLLSHRLTASRESLAVASGVVSLPQISSGAIQCSFNTRFRTQFRRVLVQIPREVPEGSGEDYMLRLRRVLCGSGRFRCRYLVMFRRVRVQIPCDVPEGSGADTLCGSGSFR